MESPNTNPSIVLASYSLQTTDYHEKQEFVTHDDPKNSEDAIA